MSDNVNQIYQRQVDVVYRVCLSYVKNKSDAEDCVSDTFMRLIKSLPDFIDADHERAWLIRTATNICKNHLKHWSRKGMDIETCDAYINSSDNPYEEEQENDVLRAVRNLPEKLRTSVMLHFYDGYNSAEIAKMLGKSESTVRNYIKDAKDLLKEMLENKTSEINHKRSYAKL